MKPSAFSLLTALTLFSSSGAVTLRAASIAWDTPRPITGASDISLMGTYVGSWAPYNGDANQFPVNGVTFQGFDTLGITQSSFDGGGNFFNSHTIPDNNYNSLLGYGVYSNDGDASFVINGNGGQPLTPGNVYQVQLWISDPRALGGGVRSATVNGSAPVLYPSDGSGMGQYLIGTFTADAPTQQFTIAANASAQLNLVQLRQVPEPSGALLGVMTGLLMLGRRRRA